MTSERSTIPATRAVGINEAPVFKIDASSWDTSGSGISGVTFAVYTNTSGSYVDVTTTVVPTGTPIVSGGTITLPPIRNLSLGINYRGVVRFTVDEMLLSCYFELIGER